MKIVVFDEERNVLDLTVDVKNPIVISPNEVEWEDGGLKGITQNYVIIEDDVEFESLMDEDIFQQLKDQHLIDTARLYEKRRIETLAFGTKQADEEVFEETRQMIINSRSTEEMIQAKKGYERRSTKAPTTPPGQGGERPIR